MGGRIEGADCTLDYLNDTAKLRQLQFKTGSCIAVVVPAVP